MLKFNNKIYHHKSEIALERDENEGKTHTQREETVINKINQTLAYYTWTIQMIHSLQNKNKQIKKRAKNIKMDLLDKSAAACAIVIQFAKIYTQ